jgi:hypothetical protein
MGAKSEEMKEANNKALLIHVEKKDGQDGCLYGLNSYGKMFLCCSYLKQTNPIETYQ